MKTIKSNEQRHYVKHPDFVPIHKYTESQMKAVLTGELGTLHGVRIVRGLS